MMQRQNLATASLDDTREKQREKQKEKQMEEQRAFQDAVNRKDREEVHRLLSIGMDINAVNEAGDTPLHQCIRDGRVDSAKLLVEFGADIRRTNRDGWSPVHLATTLGQRDLVMFLLDK